MVVDELGFRYKNREPFTITDEYDVQDLVRALLRTVSDDVRHEDPVPSVANKSTRLDFILKAEGIIVETKMTRPGLDGKKVAEELAEDITFYKGRTDWHTLVCFVYDPGRLIRNRAALQDLTRDTGRVEVRIIVVP
jgi:hypothetical protein